MSSNLVEPHGGKLVENVVSDQEVGDLLGKASELAFITIDGREKADLEMLGVGAASPLTGFTGSKDYASILKDMRLANGTVWPFPFTLGISNSQKDSMKTGDEIALKDSKGEILGVVTIEEIYKRDRKKEAEAIYKTDDEAHPGVAYLKGKSDWTIAGPVKVAPFWKAMPFAKYRLTPRELREKLDKLGWKRVAGFQTRNPIHRAHEFLTKLSLEVTDGIVIHPLVGETKSDDIPADVRFKAYNAVIDKYYPKDRVVLSVFPAAMRYAGPREAIFHALARKNYGITHFIVGRDHAGVGSYYGAFDAQEIFDTFEPGELNVTPLKFDHTFYCNVCSGMASTRTCPHAPEDRLFLSGTKVREILSKGEPLHPQFTRPEVEAVLREYYSGDAKTSSSETPERNFILWFTGLSGSGKSTLANALKDYFATDKSFTRQLEILDGDEIRTYLSKGLGFSKEDRDTNIRRIGYVARVLARNGVLPIGAAISPYTEIRDEVRELAKKDGVDFIEVFCEATVESLTERDVKGLYKKALAGEIQHFTGVSDPYEAPGNPEIRCFTDKEPVQKSLERIVGYLKEKKYL